MNEKRGDQTRHNYTSVEVFDLSGCYAFLISIFWVHNSEMVARRTSSQNGVCHSPSSRMIHVCDINEVPNVSRPWHSRAASPQLPPPPLRVDEKEAAASLLVLTGSHPTQQSSCWQSPSVPTPALMTFINEPHSCWMLMKFSDSEEQRTCDVGAGLRLFLHTDHSTCVYGTNTNRRRYEGADWSDLAQCDGWHLSETRRKHFD